jgi:hypothetical protein
MLAPMARAARVMAGWLGQPTEKTDCSPRDQTGLALGSRESDGAAGSCQRGEDVRGEFEALT